MTATELTPAEMAERTGVTIDTLRYYEREGLLSNVARADSGHRRYSDNDALWVEVLRCLRDTGMTIEQLRQYCDLGAQGDHTEPERHRILTDQGQTPAQAAIDWLRSKPWVSAPIVGANRPDQLHATIAGLDNRLSSEALAKLDEISGFRRSRPSLET